MRLFKRYHTYICTLFCLCFIYCSHCFSTALINNQNTSEHNNLAPILFFHKEAYHDIKTLYSLAPDLFEYSYNRDIIEFLLGKPISKPYATVLELIFSSPMQMEKYTKTIPPPQNTQQIASFLIDQPSFGIDTPPHWLIDRDSLLWLWLTNSIDTSSKATQATLILQGSPLFIGSSFTQIERKLKTLKKNNFSARKSEVFSYIFEQLAQLSKASLTTKERQKLHDLVKKSIHYGAFKYAEKESANFFFSSDIDIEKYSGAISRNRNKAIERGWIRPLNFQTKVLYKNNALRSEIASFYEGRNESFLDMMKNGPTKELLTYLKNQVENGERWQIDKTISPHEHFKARIALAHLDLDTLLKIKDEDLSLLRGYDERDGFIQTLAHLRVTHNINYTNELKETAQDQIQSILKGEFKKVSIEEVHIMTHFILGALSSSSKLPNDFTQVAYDYATTVFLWKNYIQLQNFDFSSVNSRGITRLSDKIIYAAALQGNIQAQAHLEEVVNKLKKKAQELSDEQYRIQNYNTFDRMNYLFQAGVLLLSLEEVSNIDISSAFSEIVESLKELHQNKEAAALLTHHEKLKKSPYSIKYVQPRILEGYAQNENLTSAERDAIIHELDILSQETNNLTLPQYIYTWRTLLHLYTRAYVDSIDQNLLAKIASQLVEGVTQEHYEVLNIFATSYFLFPKKNKEALQKAFRKLTSSVPFMEVPSSGADLVLSSLSSRSA